METIESNRKLWNTRQKELRAMLSRADKHERAIELFLTQHAVLHSAQMAQTAT